MRQKTPIIIFMATAIILCSNLGTMAQSESTELAGGPAEFISILTDRSVYVVNELICFTGTYSTASAEMEKFESTVLYIELISWDGSKIAQLKSPIKDNKISGSLRIPSDIFSGNYYLRAYTKWMRNYSPYQYTYLQVKVINPAKHGIELGPKENTSLKRSDQIKFIEQDEVLSVSGLQTTYGKRMMLEFEMEALDEKFAGSYCLSIVKAGSLNYHSPSFSFDPGLQQSTGFNLDFFPEIRGLSLSGRAIDKESATPVQDLKINLSSSSDAFYFSATKTDQEGTFLFTFPPTFGTHEFNLSVENFIESEYELLIDADFCTKPVVLPYVSFYMNGQEKGLFEEISRNRQISERFPDNATLSVSQSSLFPFYGSATRTIHEEDFIELEDVEEFLFELIYEVAIRRVDGESKIMTTGLNTTLSSYPILVLMDNVVVENIEDFLKVPCSKIDRIEVVKKGYVVGDYFYSGILSVYSSNNDLAGLKPPSNSLFFNLALYNSSVCTFPKYEHPEEKESRIPDLRTSVYWQPNIEIATDSSTKVRLYTSDSRGDYEVIIRKLEEVDSSLPLTVKRFTIE